MVRDFGSKRVNSLTRQREFIQKFLCLLTRESSYLGILHHECRGCCLTFCVNEWQWVFVGWWLTCWTSEWVRTPVALLHSLSDTWERHHHHHHYLTSSVRIFLTLSHHPFLSSIASGRSSGIHLVSTQSCCMYVRAGRPTFARPCKGSTRVHHLWARPYFSSSVPHTWFV